ncbi:putative tranposase [Rhizobium mesoamericanum STM3625]|uniref:Putative tranposase n=1 Tax=Rhizobium mesoamericanum STM3625 TaxID=1211777 RepID=K0PZS7_9HYPH|nr:putative tranposase [Rhizobium mesoamericanum STM3625]
MKLRIKDICQTRVRYGYRRVHVLLKREGWPVNSKRIYRLYEMDLQLRNKVSKRRVKAKLRASDEPPFDVEQVLAKLAPQEGHAFQNLLETMDWARRHTCAFNTGERQSRIVKRMLNVIRMRASVARWRGMALDESVIAKLALFERCTSERILTEPMRPLYQLPVGTTLPMRCRKQRLNWPYIGTVM